MGNGMNKIVPGLYIGSIYDSRSREQLKENGITHILSIHDKEQTLIPDFRYLRINSKDNSREEIIQHFRACNQFIHEARLKGGHVLVHCLAGMSRSVTVATAYLMVVTRQPWNDILAAIRQCRLVASPNTGFKLQLDRFEGELADQEREWLKSMYGVLDAFGDTSRIQALYHQHMACDDVSTTSGKEKRRNIANMSVSSSDYFHSAADDDDVNCSKMQQMSVNGLPGDDVTLLGSGSRCKQRLPLNTEEEVSWKSLKNYEQENMDE